MATDSNAPPARPQGPPDNPASPGLIWSAGFSHPIDITVNGKPFDYFRQWKPKRERRKQPVNSPDGYMSRVEAARYLDVSVRFLEGNASIPKVNVARPGSKRATWRYRKSDLDAWMTARQRSGKRGRDD
jgi:hypothetical protein